MLSLEKAILLALQAHRGRKDKAGEPLILHSLRLMMRMSSEEEMTAAILHDIIEQTEMTMQELELQGFSEEVLRAVECLTCRHGERYGEFIERVCREPVARRIKLADVEDDMKIGRLESFTEEDEERFRRHIRAWFVLTSEEKK